MQDNAIPLPLGLFDPTADWTPQEIAIGNRYLLKVKAKEYRWPDEESMQIAHGVISYWAPEIVIMRGGGDKRQILLAIYDGGAGFPAGSWHIPGGYNLWPELDIQATIARVAKRELGREVVYVEILDEHKWTSEEHRYGHPLSLYCSCRTDDYADIPEIPGRLQYFALEELPATLLGPHRVFAERYLAART